MNSLPDRFWIKVNKNGPIPVNRPELGPCWIWLGSQVKGGYGNWGVSGGKNQSVHVSTFITLIGPIPDGLELDHLCRIRNCCNPTHLEPVTHAENTRRSISFQASKTHCAKGHLFNEENTRMAKKSKGGYQRMCRICHRLATKKCQGDGKRKAKRDAIQQDK